MLPSETELKLHAKLQRDAMQGIEDAMQDCAMKTCVLDNMDIVLAWFEEMIEFGDIV
jgi:hypothetical protein